MHCYKNWLAFSKKTENVQVIHTKFMASLKFYSKISISITSSQFYLKILIFCVVAMFRSFRFVSFSALHCIAYTQLSRVRSRNKSDETTEEISRKFKANQDFSENF